MKKINKPGYIALGMVLALIIGMATPAFAVSKDVSKQITAYFTSGGKSISVYINGNKITPIDGNGNEVYPFTVDGTTYLPVRAVASALGKTVTWDGTTASVKIDDSTETTTIQNNTNAKPNTDSVKQLTAYYTSGGKTISIYINGTKITPKDGNGKVVEPFTVNGTTYLPVRAICEALGKTVTWDGSTISVKINDIKAPWSSKDSIAKLTTTVDTNGNRIDSLDYTFTSDKDTVGEWVFYDVIRNLSDFDPNDTHVGPQNWSGNSFYEDGTLIEHHYDGVAKRDLTASIIHNWTKGYIMDTDEMDEEKVVPAYSIIIADGKTYMIVEWKSGYYTRTGKLECYYVFEKTSDTPAPKPVDNTTSNDPKITVTKDANGGLHDSMDYKFVTDKDAVGKWEAIDFVDTLDQFNSKDTTRRKYVWPCTYNFYDDGKMVTSSIDGATGLNKDYEQLWTKGYVVATEDTVPAYVIKQLNGKTFMLYEWKSGDYTIRGQKPSYFVLVKTSDTPDPDAVKK